VSAGALRAYPELVRGRRLAKRGGWRALVSALPPRPTGGRPADVDVHALAAGCARAARRLPLDTACLERSYATCSVLRRHGIGSVLAVGVSRSAPMRFHAWVEVDDEVLNESQPIHRLYRVLCRL
jgi:hypothetical protein